MVFAEYSQELPFRADDGGLVPEDGLVHIHHITDDEIGPSLLCQCRQTERVLHLGIMMQSPLRPDDDLRALGGGFACLFHHACVKLRHEHFLVLILGDDGRDRRLDRRHPYGRAVRRQ